MSITKKVIGTLLQAQSRNTRSFNFPIRQRETLKKLANDDEHRNFQYEQTIVHRPNQQSPDLLDRTFYRIENCTLPRYGLLFNYDRYFQKDDFTLEDVILDQSIKRHWTKILDTERRMSQRDAASNLIFTFFHRVENVAITEYCNDTLEAFSYLYHVGKLGKKVVLVSTHGDTDTRNNMWRLGSGRRRVYADEVLSLLSLRYNPRTTGAIVIYACNDDGIPVKMSHEGKLARIPVIAGADDFGRCPLKIYWPLKRI